MNAPITFSVKHSCGHESTHAHAGSEQELKQRQAWLQRQPCQTCWRQTESNSAAAQSEEWKLPPLEGAVEDIPWAEVIRTKAITHNKAYHKKLTGSKGLDGEDETLRSALITAADDALRELESQRSAAWWIEHRFEALTYIKPRVVAAITPIMNARNE